MPSTRTCSSCGAPVAADASCARCALAGALDELGFNAPRALPRFSPLDLPSHFGNYRVEREVAAGGMGMVYEAEDTRLGRRVALKMLRQVLFATEQDRLRFQTEAELASRLDHPHIVPIHEVGVQDGQPFFTMKFIRGGNLAERLTAGPLPVRDAAALMAKIAGAVHHAHQRGVLHRDLKPANILLDEAGEPWLTDFGVAKWLDGNTGLTLTRSMVGTPEYMSPEQAAGRTGEVSTASDVWALGVMLHQMLTGRLPFGGESAQEVFRKITEKEVRSLTKKGRKGFIGQEGQDSSVPSVPHVASVPEDLSTLCLRCLGKNPALRPSSAGELAEELRRFLRGEPIRSRRITALERLGKWARRHPWLAGLSCALALAVFGGSAAVTWQWRRATANERKALQSEAAEREEAATATLAQALSAREHHDFDQARRLLADIPAALRGFDWRLVQGLCRGDEAGAWRLPDGEASGTPACLALMPDGKSLAIITTTGLLLSWDPATEQFSPPRVLPPLPGPAAAGRHYRGLTFSPDGRRLAYSCNDVLQVLDAANLVVVFEEISSLPQCGWLDSDRLLYGFNGSVARPPWPAAGAWILDFSKAAAGTRDIPRTAFPQMCAPLAVAPDRRSFALQKVIAEPSSWARTLHVFAADGPFTPDAAPLYTLPGAEYPGVLTFSASGKHLAFSAGPGLRQSARVVETATGRVVFDNTFRFPIFSLEIDPAGSLLGIAGGDSALRVYEFARPLPVPPETLTYDDAVAPARRQPADGRGAHEPPRDFITRSAGEQRAIFYLGHEKQIADLRFVSGGGLITAGLDGTLRQWSAGVPQRHFRMANVWSSYDFYHPAASADGKAVLWFDGATASLCQTGTPHAGMPVLTLQGRRQAPLAVTTDGRILTHDRTTTEVVIWKVQNGAFREVQRLNGNWPHGNHSGRTREGILSDDEQRLAGCYEGILYTADLATGIMRWGGPRGELPARYATRYASHALSPDGNWVAATGIGTGISICRFEQPEKLHATLTGAARGYDTAVCFSRDSSQLFVGNEDGRVRVWNTATWQEQPALSWPAHRSAVTALAASHDGTLIATSGDDTLKLYPTRPPAVEPRRRERLSFILDQPANWIRFARDAAGADRALLHCSPDGALVMWEAEAKAP